MAARKTGDLDKLYRSIDRKAAVLEAQKLKKATLKKTAKLRELRLAKEAEDRAAEAAKPKVKKKPTRKKKLPAFERDT